MPLGKESWSRRLCQIKCNTGFLHGFHIWSFNDLLAAPSSNCESENTETDQKLRFDFHLNLDFVVKELEILGRKNKSGLTNHRLFCRMVYSIGVARCCKHE